MASFEIEGVPAFRAALKRAGDRAPLAMAAALVIEAEGAMRESRELVPVDNSILKGSGVVLPPEITARGVTVDFGYGGEASDYAVIQHERTDFRHTVGQAKFLEQPVLERASGMGTRMAATVRKFLERR